MKERIPMWSMLVMVCVLHALLVGCSGGSGSRPAGAVGAAAPVATVQQPPDPVAPAHSPATLPPDETPASQDAGDPDRELDPPAASLAVHELPVVSAEIDGPGHLEYSDRLGATVLARIEALRAHAEEQKLAEANEALAPFGFRLEARFDAEWGRTFYDLFQDGKADPVLASLSQVWPVSVNASGTDFCLVAENAPNALRLNVQVHADGVWEWPAEESNWLPPAFVGDALARVTITGFPNLNYEVRLDDEVVYRGTAVAQGASMPLHVFTAWDDHWVLEVDDHLIMDGHDLGESLGYHAAFGFHLIQGQPFYFFRQDNRVHISFAGQTLPNVYDQVFHNQCCEASMHNVQALGDTVLFHALWDGTWYVVEAGADDGEVSGAGRNTTRWRLCEPDERLLQRLSVPAVVALR